MKSFEPWENFSPSPPKIISCLYIWSKHWASSCCCRKWHTPNLMVFWQQPLFQTQGKSNNHDDKKDSWLDGLRSLIFYYDTYGIYRGKFFVPVMLIHRRKYNCLRWGEFLAIKCKPASIRRTQSVRSRYCRLRGPSDSPRLTVEMDEQPEK